MYPRPFFFVTTLRPWYILAVLYTHRRCTVKRVVLAVAVVAVCAVWAGVSFAEEAPAMEQVESTLIKEISYDASTQTLTVVFVNSEDVYEYRGVPASVYEELKNAESKGSYFVKNIKDKYEFTKR